MTKHRRWRVLHKPQSGHRVPAPVKPDPTGYEFTELLLFLADNGADAHDHLDHCFGEGGWDPSSLKMIGWMED